MSKYIAAFYSHFGALSYCKALQQQGLTAQLRPVPRNISSSCGTCVYYEHDAPVDMEGCELEGVYEAGEVLKCVLKK